MDAATELTSRFCPERCWPAGRLAGVERLVVGISMAVAPLQSMFDGSLLRLSAQSENSDMPPKGNSGGASVRQNDRKTQEICGFSHQKPLASGHPNLPGIAQN